MFKKIFYINLDKDINRAQFMTDQLTKLFPNIESHRFRAFDRDYVNSNSEVIKPKVQGSYLEFQNGKFPKPGAIGCYLSHLQVIKDIVNSCENSLGRDDYYLVLEDDCLLPIDISDFLRAMLDSAIFDWTILKPCCRKFDDAHRFNDIFFKTNLSINLDYNYYFGTHMLIYRGSEIAAVIKQLETLRIMDIDYIINKLLTGVFAFELSSDTYIKQSNEGGSNTTDGEVWSAFPKI